MSELREVHLRQLPVQLWAQAQEQNDALLREFALITTADATAAHGVPRRLLDLIARIQTRFAGVSAEQDLALLDAADRGVQVLDLTYRVPDEVTGAASELNAMLDEADTYCADGSLLLTLASTEEVVRFRTWFLAQFVDQVAGWPPVAWPDWT